MLKDIGALAIERRIRWHQRSFHEYPVKDGRRARSLIDVEAEMKPSWPPHKSWSISGWCHIGITSPDTNRGVRRFELRSTHMQGSAGLVRISRLKSTKAKLDNQRLSRSVVARLGRPPAQIDTTRLMVQVLLTLLVVNGLWLILRRGFITVPYTIWQKLTRSDLQKHGS